MGFSLTFVPVDGVLMEAAVGGVVLTIAMALLHSIDGMLLRVAIAIPNRVASFSMRTILIPACKCRYFLFFGR